LVGIETHFCKPSSQLSTHGLLMAAPETLAP
jgi:hypothetical protein